MTGLLLRAVMVIGWAFAVVFEMIGTLSGCAAAPPARRDDDGGGDRHGGY